MTKYQELSVEDCHDLMVAKAKRLVEMAKWPGDILEDRGELIQDLVKLHDTEVALVDAEQKKGLFRKFGQ